MTNIIVIPSREFRQPKEWSTPDEVGKSRRGRPAKVHDNTAVRQFAACFWNASDLTRTYPSTDDILAGVLELKGEGDSATRSLSRSGLFHILSHLDSISVESVRALFRSRYAERTARRYAEAARVASTALSAYINTLNDAQAAKRNTSRLADMRAIDAPYAADATKAEAKSRPWSLPRLHSSYRHAA